MLLLWLKLGLGICCCKQSHPRHQLCWNATKKLLGGNWNHVPHLELARRREANTVRLSRKNPRRNLPIYGRSRGQSRECHDSVSASPKPRLFCRCNIPNAKIQMESVKDAWVSQFSATWSWDETKLLSVVAAARGQTLRSRHWSKDETMEWVSGDKCAGFGEWRANSQKHFHELPTRSSSRLNPPSWSPAKARSTRVERLIQVSLIARTMRRKSRRRRLNKSEQSTKAKQSSIKTRISTQIKAQKFKIAFSLKTTRVM